MTNKEYKNRKTEHENAIELATFEHWNGFSFYPSYCMTTDDSKELKKEYKSIKNGFTLDGFNNRALCVPFVNDNGVNGLILYSYYTPVAMLYNGEFIKLWRGYSVTTLKHINILRKNGGLKPLNKREWVELETAENIGNKYYCLEYINAYTGECITVHEI